MRVYTIISVDSHIHWTNSAKIVYIVMTTKTKMVEILLKYIPYAAFSHRNLRLFRRKAVFEAVKDR